MLHMNGVTMRKVVFPLLLSFISIGVSLFAAELVLRKFYRQHYRNGLWEASYKFEPDDRLIYRLRPDAISELNTSEFNETTFTNSEGFRGMPFSVRKPKDTYRIIFAGDSFTFGHGLSDDDTYPSRFGDILSSVAPKDRKIEVINAGVAGYTPDQEYRQIMEILPKYEPDMIVWNLISYDFDDIFGPLPALYGIDGSGTKLVSYDGRMNWMYIRDRLYNGVPPFVRKSYVFDLALSRLSAFYPLRRKPQLTEDTQLDWAEKKLTLELRSAAHQMAIRKIKLVVVHLPVDQEYGASRGYATDMFNEVFKGIEKKLASIKVPYIDVETDLAELKKPDRQKTDGLPDSVLSANRIDTAEPRKLFYAVNGHPNEQGATAIAAIVAGHLNPYIFPSSGSSSLTDKEAQ